MPGPAGRCQETHAPPYVLVGHSIGGFHIRLYRHQYPEKVVGLVPVDSAHPDQFSRWRALLPPQSPNDSAGLKQVREEVTVPFQDPSPEEVDFETSAAQVRTTDSLGNLPLVVLSAGLSDWPFNLPEDVRAKLIQVDEELQKELIGLSSDSQLVATRSHHYIVGDEPELVVEVVLKFFEAVQNK